jgi:membrane-associated protease RseP (regulator of RpoE activity)
MRLVSAFLFVALTGSAVVAEEAKPADPKPEVTKKKMPYRVVKMLPETGQVLLFNKQQGNHVVAEVGQTLDGYTVDDIDEDEVTLISESGASVILAAPPPPPPRQARRAAKAKAEPVDADGGAQDASDAAKAPAPVDPYAEPEAPKAPGEGGVRVASAAAPSTATGAPTAPPAPIVDAGPMNPSDPYGDPGIAAFADAVNANAADTRPAKPVKGKPAKQKPAQDAASADAASALASAATGAPESASAAAPRTASASAGATVVARTELDAALADFAKTAGTFRATFTPDGLRFDSVAEGSLLAKVGLRKGDIVTYVDGKPLRSLDDAASLYARAGSMRATTIQVARDGKNVTLRVAIQ